MEKTNIKYSVDLTTGIGVKYNKETEDITKFIPELTVTPPFKIDEAGDFTVKGTFGVKTFGVEKNELIFLVYNGKEAEPTFLKLNIEDWNKAIEASVKIKESELSEVENKNEIS